MFEFVRTPLFAILMLAASAAAADPTPLELLKASDRARGGEIGGITMTSTVIAYQDNVEDKSYTLKIEADQDNSLVTFLKPATAAGKMMLMQNRNMWFLSPDVSKPVPISPRQRLLGEASNGDVATTNYSRDYDATPAGEAEVAGQPCYVLDLKAKDANVAYDKIRYYVAKDSQLALKAEYMTVSDKHFKTALMEYANRVEVAGKSQPFVSKIEIQDEVQTGQKTVLVYDKVEAAAVPPSRFDLRALLSR
ncbi:outer membrane lipoprotein-sorting protein [Methylomonas sp. HW2-6]|uniref:outer membrane lipoprotein-sorting protein n=1 Tax=Methylomonas sp. HW2-6 TaxID=3376687 RepID=UPI0040438898